MSDILCWNLESPQKVKKDQLQCVNKNSDIDGINEKTQDAHQSNAEMAFRIYVRAYGSPDLPTVGRWLAEDVAESTGLAGFKVPRIC